MDEVDGETDGQLLRAFVETRSEAAFERLMRRHERLVMGVCLRLLDRQDAEDAAQAVFLALAHKAATLTREGSIAGWLHHVARQVALNQRKAAARRTQRESPGAVEKAGMNNMPQSQPPTDAAQWAEARVELDAAVDALPAKYREPLVLHHLEGLTQEQTARLLNEKTGTISMRLNRARELLRAALVARQINLSSVALLSFLAAESSATGLGSATASATIKAAGLIAAKNFAAAGAMASAPALHLTKGVLNMLFLARLKLAALIASAVLLAGSGAGWVAWTARAAEKGAPLADEKPAPAPITPSGVENAAALPAILPPVPLTANGGSLHGPIAIARRFPWAHKILWNFDNSKLLLVVDNHWHVEGHGGMKREGPDEYDTYRVDLKTNAVHKLYTAEGLPGWLVGDRLVLRLKGKLSIVDPDGKVRVLPGLDWFQYSISRDGKWLAYATRSIGGETQDAPRIVSVESGSIAEIRPPHEKPAGDEGLELAVRTGFWSDDNRLVVASAWSKSTKETAEAYSGWFYAPATGAYEATQLFGTSWSIEPYSRRENSIMLTNDVWLTSVGAKDWKKPDPTPAKPPPPDTGGGGEPAAPPHGKPESDGGLEPDVMPVEALDFTAESGKVLRHVALDTAAIHHAGLRVDCVSTDRRYAVASLFKKFQRLGAFRRPVVDAFVILDLASGGVVATLDTRESGNRIEPVAIFSATRQVLANGRDRTGDSARLWAFNFDGTVAGEISRDRKLQRWGVYDDCAAFRRDSIYSGTERFDWDRYALTVTPMNFANVLDPKYDHEPFQLYVYWNSARPIRAFVSHGREDAAHNVTWSRDGGKLAFTADDRLFIWTPANDGKEAGPEPTDAAPREDF